MELVSGRLTRRLGIRHLLPHPVPDLLQGHLVLGIGLEGAPDTGNGPYHNIAVHQIELYRVRLQMFPDLTGDGDLSLFRREDLMGESDVSQTGHPMIRRAF